METPIGSAPVREPTLSAAADLSPKLHLTARRPRCAPAWFGELPKRILPEEMIEERAATMPNPATNTYNADEWLVRYCL
ncbi:hypothetical protein OG894_01030 [Streptomyces sp. NBC_01724]|uniref:hypothetical protein n=1 Tax=unclassified Streptomyces TaxID=2593676 RepID=UPI002E338465|nr:hypothetical protein [Streptomyces sp. NBC_01724]WTE56590.1 hypothetical protein OG987_41625 [Streptomyces sp. NBC_01620]WTE64661.1 hypothetical protein OG784_41355 [Streptomyces sp. NBC_01617]